MPDETRCTVFKVNPEGAYALYTETVDTELRIEDLLGWRVSASVQNFQVSIANELHYELYTRDVALAVLEQTPVTKPIKVKSVKRNTKYDRIIYGLDGGTLPVDVYRVIDAFEIQSGALQHAVKKICAPGQRGHKTYKEDLIDIRDSINCAIALEEQKEHA